MERATTALEQEQLLLGQLVGLAEIFLELPEERQNRVRSYIARAFNMGNQNANDAEAQPWTAEEDAEVARMVDEGATTSQIARHFKRYHQTMGTRLLRLRLMRFELDDRGNFWLAKGQEPEGTHWGFPLYQKAFRSLMRTRNASETARDLRVALVAVHLHMNRFYEQIGVAVDDEWQMTG